MSSFVLKIIGIFTMLFDHLSDSVFGKFTNLNYVGRIAFPLFAFQITQGYLHTKNLKEYFIRLIGFAIVSQLPFHLFQEACGFSPSLNIFFTLFLGLLAIFAYDKILHLKMPNDKSGLFSNRSFLLLLALIVVFGISSIGNVIKVDYGMYGVLTVFVFYALRNKKIGMCISFILLTCLQYAALWIQSPQTWLISLLCVLFTCLSLIFILAYNGKEGPKCKYLFYMFYPLHLLLLSFL